MPQKLPRRSLEAFAASALLAGLPLAASAEVPDIEQSTVLSGLESPWDMAFLPDGAMFFTEKCKGLSVRLPNGDVNNLLGMSGTDGYASTADDLICGARPG